MRGYKNMVIEKPPCECGHRKYMHNYSKNVYCHLCDCENYVSVGNKKQ